MYFLLIYITYFIEMKTKFKKIIPTTSINNVFFSQQ